MASAKYDEDVYENPFFHKIMTDYADYLERAVTSKGILCVPKYSIASEWRATEGDVEDHILLPTKEIVDDDDDFITVSNKTVHISDGKIITKAGFDALREVPVLFAETFHTDSGGSYRVFCIGGLLNKTISKSAAGASPEKQISPQNYRQWLERLWTNAGGQKMRDVLDKNLNTYAATYDRLEGETLRSIVDAASTQFTKAMQLLLKDSGVRRSAKLNASYMENLKIAVETYVMNSIHKSLFRVITATMASEDAEINKITRNLVDLQLSDLGIRKIFSQNILPAKKELSMLNRYSTPMGRLFCIKRVVSALTKPPKHLNKDATSKDTVAMMTTDDLLPILIFLIIKSEIPNWMANLTYMRHFHFAKSSDDDEFGFYLATVEAALEHIKSGNIKDEIKPLKRERWNSTLNTDYPDASSSSSSSSSPTSPSAPSTPQRQTSHLSTIEEFFRSVQDGDEKTVQQMLERPHKTSEQIHLKLCHPLCSCDKCDKLMSNLRNNSDLVTAYTRDNRGYTALHIAAYYGQGLLIDLLVKNHAVVDATDYLGLTPLHLACQRGYQNVMLLLLHFGADIMATDNEGNTALHLCCANGHDDCVKALVFYDASMRKLHINAANEIGDTPLHYAAKWGYESIVKTLLENGADSTLCNRKRQTAVSLAQNVKVQRWLQLSAEGLDFQPIRPQFVNPNATPRSRSSSTSSSSTLQNSFAIQRSATIDLYEPTNSSFRIETASLEAASESERRRQKEKLFKAIIGGDIQLVKFYLGVQSPTEFGDEDDDVIAPLSSVSLKDMCHPLCQCDTCLGVQRATRKSGDNMNVNVKTSTGYCPLHMAVLHNHSDIVELLISLKADISAQNHKSFTPLHLACCIRNSLITDMLVKAGAGIDLHDINGDTPLLIAASNGFVNGVHILIKSGAKLNATNNKGNTALMEAVKRDHGDIAKLLLSSGADPRIKNKQGQLAVHEADDQQLQGILMAASYRMNDAEMKSQNHNHSHQPHAHGSLDRSGTNNGQIRIKELFAAFEEKDLQALQSLTASIRSFDRKGTLKRTRTIDKSAPFLKPLIQRHSIHSFDQNTLRKTKSVDKNDPLHLYAVSQSGSFDSSSLPTRARVKSALSHNESFTSVGSTDSFPRDYSFDDPSMMPFPEVESLDSTAGLGHDGKAPPTLDEIFKNSNSDSQNVDWNFGDDLTMKSDNNESMFPSEKDSFSRDVVVASQVPNEPEPVVAEGEAQPDLLESVAKTNQALNVGGNIQRESEVHVLSEPVPDVEQTSADLPDAHQQKDENVHLVQNLHAGAQKEPEASISGRSPCAPAESSSYTDEAMAMDASHDLEPGFEHTVITPPDVLEQADENVLLLHAHKSYSDTQKEAETSAVESSFSPPVNTQSNACSQSDTQKMTPDEDHHGQILYSESKDNPAADSSGNSQSGASSQPSDISNSPESGTHTTLDEDSGAQELPYKIEKEHVDQTKDNFSPDSNPHEPMLSLDNPERPEGNIVNETLDQDS